MASTGVGNGLAKISIDGVVCTYLINCTYSVEHSPRNITNKDSTAGVNQYAPGLVDETAQGEAYQAEDGTWNFSDAYSFARNRTLVWCEFGNVVSGDKIYEGNAYFTNATYNSPNVGENDNHSFAVIFTGGTAENTAS